MSSIAVIDVETTGLRPLRHDRVVEVAVVVVTPDGNMLREYATLVNPERDIGPTSVHGLTSADIINAPTFEMIAGDVIEAMEDCVAMAGHNFRFDHAFMTEEFKRLDVVFPAKPSICTMTLASGGSLEACCQAHQILLGNNAHSALHDAKATAQLLSARLRNNRKALTTLNGLPPITWPDVPMSSAEAVSRSKAKLAQKSPPSYIQRLIQRPRIKEEQITDEAAVAYIGLLDRVLEDRRVDEAEVDALVDLAEHLRIGSGVIQKLHHAYLRRLIRLAWADGVMTDVERNDFSIVGRLLGIDTPEVDKLLTRKQTPTPHQLPPVTKSLSGLSVCFTGELQASIGGIRIDRGQAENLAKEHGLVPAKSVTKKLDLLIVSDAYTQSSKAEKARAYGTRIIQEMAFWQALGVSVD
tara:strand:+ start:837 stop:2069 length:1233 start_codon:yes stop_codon:yes gene_type:complete